jgi:hypothetical protein
MSHAAITVRACSVAGLNLAESYSSPTARSQRINRKKKVPRASGLPAHAFSSLLPWDSLCWCDRHSTINLLSWLPSSPPRHVEHALASMKNSSSNRHESTESRHVPASSTCHFLQCVYTPHQGAEGCRESLGSVKGSRWISSETHCVASI